MANTAAHLVDRILPDVPVRKYVLSLPFELRALAAFKPEVLRAMARLFVESIFGLYRTRARRDGLMGGECGAVTFVQRFGGSLNLNVHMHVVVLDGVFVRDADHGVVFHAAPPPTLVDLEAIVRRVGDRALAWFRRRGLLDERPLEERSNEAPDPAAIDGCAAIAMYRGRARTKPTAARATPVTSAPHGRRSRSSATASTCTRACGSKQATTLDANVCAAMGRARRSRSNAFGGSREDASPTG